jgi:hypothetical protein
MKKTKIKVKNRKTGETKTVQVDAKIVDDWGTGEINTRQAHNNALRYIERLFDSGSAFIKDGFIVVKIGK